MTKQEIMDETRKIIRDCLPDQDLGDLSEDSVINTDTAIDSMGFTLILCKLEARFDVRIPSRQWAKLSTLGDVADAVLKAKGQ